MVGWVEGGYLRRSHIPINEKAKILLQIIHQYETDSEGITEIETNANLSGKRKSTGVCLTRGGSHTF